MKIVDGKYVEEERDKVFFAKLACRLPKMLGGGHLRGIALALPPEGFALPAGHRSYRCRRCGSVWSRKVISNRENLES